MSEYNWNLSTGKEKRPRLIEHSSGYVVSEVTSPIPIGRGKRFNLTIPKLNRLSGNNKFGYISDFNASGSNPTVQPVPPAPAPTPPVSWLDNITPWSGKTTPAPDAEPTLNSSKNETPATPSGSEVAESTEHYIPYVVSLLIGIGVGYEVAKKHNKSSIGGILLGGSISAGCVWLYFNQPILKQKI